MQSTRPSVLDYIAWVYFSLHAVCKLHHHCLCVIEVWQSGRTFTPAIEVIEDASAYRLAELFVKPAFFEPLVALQDPLSGLHANTHLAQVRPSSPLPTLAHVPLCPGLLASHIIQVHREAD